MVLHTSYLIGIILCVVPYCCSYSQKNVTQHHKFEDICPPDGSKKELNMRNGMWVFVFDESDPKTRDSMSLKDFNCHLELETYPDFGFHVFFDEMALDEQDSGSCRDYVQFARDIGPITNYQSQKYCGTIPKMKLNVADTLSLHRNRLYVENQDHEMDIWLNVQSRKAVGDGLFKPRNLTLVVTVFKKGCTSKDPYFRACPHTQYCIRHEYFCDGYVSCAWPSGEDALDETDDCNYDSGSHSSASDIFAPANIPVIIIIVIVVLALVTIFAIACRRFVGMVKKNSTETEEERRLRIPLGLSLEPPRRVEVRPTIEEFSGSATDPTNRYPVQPPSYEEAIKSMQGQMPLSRISSDPPPYSHTTTDV